MEKYKYNNIDNYHGMDIEKEFFSEKKIKLK